MTILLVFPLEKQENLGKEELNDSSGVIQMVSPVTSANVNVIDGKAHALF